jgi:predicted nucleotide-binding protein (sugar kinase/HSP70/actin superfamily)
LGQQALDFCDEHGVTPIIVLGRSYTIYNPVLNSNVPAIVREQGALPIPIDCYPVAADVPVFEDVFWGYGQRNLRAAHQIRRTEGTYSIWCSNYACGPDSFCLPLYAYQMEGKPYAVIETDGHSGDAGTKTRVEAFLYCVREDLARTERRSATSLHVLEQEKAQFTDVRARGEIVLITRMGPDTEALASCMRGVGVRAETLPMPTRERLALGRRHTSGKECVPLTLTVGTILQRLEEDRHNDTRFAVFMPTANGPCRFGLYALLHKVIYERLGWKDRVRVWSPHDAEYFADIPRGFSVLVMSGFMCADLMQEMLFDARPAERSTGAALRIYEEASAELFALLEKKGSENLELGFALGEVANGRLFGCAALLERTARRFAEVRVPGPLPTVAVVGEIYVRCDPFANDFVIDRLQARGIRVRFAPFNEWLEYTDYLAGLDERQEGFASWLSSQVQGWIQRQTYQIVTQIMGWPPRTRVQDALDAAAPYIRADLHGEAVLTVGAPVHEWRHGHIDAVLNVGPLECMPSKIAEAQFFHVAEQEGLLTLTLPFNGDPLDPELFDRFVFDVEQRFRQRQRHAAHQAPSAGISLFAQKLGQNFRLGRAAPVWVKSLARAAGTARFGPRPRRRE